MKKIVLFFLVVIAFSFTLIPGDGKFNYPKAKKVDSTDVYFGTKVNDPYRWLENDTSAETAQWVNLENALTIDYLSGVPYRDKIKDRLTALWNFEKNTTPVKRGNYYFFQKNNGIQNQNVIYVQEGLKGTPKILLDPNKFAKDGTVSINGISIRKDGKYMAYNMAQAGSDWNEIHVMDVQKGKMLKDSLPWVKFSEASWLGDGFYYSRYPVPVKGMENSGQNQNNKVYFHKLGDPQSKDELVFEDPKNPKRNYNISVTEDEATLCLYGAESTSGNSLAIKSLKNNEKVWNWVEKGFEWDFSVVDRLETGLLVLTNHKASNNKLILLNETNPTLDASKVLIPESRFLLESVSLMGGKMVAKYLSNVTNKLAIFSLVGTRESEFILPGVGIVASFSSDKDDRNAFFSFTNFVTPTTIYRFSMDTYQSEVHFKPNVDFDSDRYESKQVFYESKDGTKIPMFITHKKNLLMEGKNPTLLYGYGGFNISVTPSFSVPVAVLLENGFVYAVANIRGGGEYGEDWHKAGTYCSKQNVFDDFAAAAAYLSKQAYTNNGKLAIHGRSNGGLLVGATITQNPGICAVALPGVGVQDMLRYHKFTIGHFWATDYGRSDNPAHFPCLYKYSPVHNVKSEYYPATLITTADHDDRVVPAHSFKFAATLQEYQQGPNPVLIRIDIRAGHGSGKPVTKQIEEWADMWAFTMKNLDCQPPVK